MLIVDGRRRGELWVYDTMIHRHHTWDPRAFARATRALTAEECLAYQLHGVVHCHVEEKGEAPCLVSQPPLR